jgi:hypothetical protein
VSYIQWYIAFIPGSCDQVTHNGTAWGVFYAHTNHKEGSTVKSMYVGPARNPRGCCDFVNGARVLPFECRKMPPLTYISKERSALDDVIWQTKLPALPDS